MFTHTLGSAPLLDPQGRWYEDSFTTSLPVFPGLRTTELELPGLPGATRVGFSPHQSQSITLSLVVNAFSKDKPVPAGRGARIQVITDNMNALMRGISMGGQGVDAITLKRAYPNGTNHYGIGYIKASSAPDYSPGADHARVTLIFTIADGLWRAGATRNRSLLAPFGATATPNCLSGSTAPVHDTILGIVGPVTEPGIVSPVTGAGFLLATVIPAGKWMVVDTARWTHSGLRDLPATSGAPAASTATLRGDIRPVRRAAGSALTLMPSDGNDPQMSLTGGGTTKASGVYVYGTPAYF